MTNCHAMKWTMLLVSVLLLTKSSTITTSAFQQPIASSSNNKNNNHHQHHTAFHLPPLPTSSPPLSLRPPCSSSSSCIPRHPFVLHNQYLATLEEGGDTTNDDKSLPTEPTPPPTPTTTTTNTNTIVTPVFDFTGGATIADEEKAKSLASFDRIDDAIMGGISLSALKDAGVGVPYASWSGKCRIEGGGFCGFRTLPFKEALDTTNQDGIYINCRLASDDEPQRRVWKMTMRTQSKRTTEIVYQAEFTLGTNDGGEGEWSRVRIPFDSFQLVRGPRLVPDMPPADVSDGIFQIGVSLSKFVMGVNMTELSNFRPGYFELQIQSIGFYTGGEVIPVGSSSTTTTTSSAAATAAAVTQRGITITGVEDGTTLGDKPIIPETVSKAQVDKDRPLLFKVLSPVLKFFFSEQSRRRKTAMKLLTETRGLSRRQAIVFGIQSRRKGRGLVRSVGKTLGIIGVDAMRAVLFNLLKVVLFYPFKVIFGVVRGIKKALGMEVKKPITG